MCDVRVCWQACFGLLVCAAAPARGGCDVGGRSSRSLLRSWSRTAVAVAAAAAAAGVSPGCQPDVVKFLVRGPRGFARGQGFLSQA